MATRKTASEIVKSNKTATTSKETKETINFKPLSLGVLKIKVVGTSPYMPEPMDMEVLERYNKIKSQQSYTKDIISEEDKVKEKFYYTTDGKYGIPVRAFYNSMIRASSYLFDIKQGGMRNIKEGVTIKGDIIPLKYKDIKVLTHWGRTSGATKSPHKIMRNAFYDWSCELEIQYNKNNLSAEQIINVLNWAGFHIGVGSFRKEKTGNFGLFTVEI
jgi:hypothetical protein